MLAALRIAGKDLKLRLRDRSAIITGVIAPLALAVIFYFVFGSAFGGAGGLDLEYGIVDLDGSEVSTPLVGVLVEAEEAGLLVVEEYPDRGPAEAALGEEIDAYIVIPQGFGDLVVGGNAASIEVVGDVDAQTSTLIAGSIAEQYAAGVESGRLAFITAQTLGGASPAGDPATAAFSYEMVDMAAETRQLNPATYFAAGMAVFFLFFTVQFGVLGLLEEERDGTLTRLLAAPIGRRAVVSGKAILAFALGVIAMTVLAVSTQLIIPGAEWGAPLGVALLIVTGVLAAVGIMGLVASAAKTAEGAGNLGSIIAVILGMLGGVFFQIGTGEDLLSRLTFVTPHAWFMRGLGELAGGADWTAALPAAGALGLFALVTGAIGWVLVNRRLES
ncbi:MAG: ABC transporter permease [Acidimicrobiia bacterium]|nr:ABC transporter permease [Acidimicrobiia bacterium]